jgi:hypothetical protein
MAQTWRRRFERPAGTILDNQAGMFLPPTCIPRGQKLVVPKIIDLRNGAAAYVRWAWASGGNTTLATAGIGISFQPQDRMGMARKFVGATATRVRTLDGAVAKGALQYKVAGSGGTAPAAEQFVGFWGRTAVLAEIGALPGAEFARISRVDSADHYIEFPLHYAHVTAELVGLGESTGEWLMPGHIYECVVDYQRHSAGEAVMVAIDVQVYADTVAGGGSSQVRSAIRDA